MESNLKSSIRNLRSEAHSEIISLKAQHPEPLDLVKQLEKAFLKVFEAISLVADKVDKLEAK